MTASINKKNMTVYIILISGVVLTIVGLILGLKIIEFKFYNLLVAIMLGVFAVFGFLGKYNQDVKSGEHIMKIDKTTLDTYDNITNTNLTNLKASIRRYRELEAKFNMTLSGMTKMSFVHYNNGAVRLLSNTVNTNIDEILQSSFISEHEDLYKEWQLIRNLTLEYLSFYNLPNGVIYSEEDKSIVLSNENKNEKLKKLNSDLMLSENRINYKIQSVMKSNGIEE